MNLGKYNQAKTITFDLVAPDGVDLIIAATFAAGDIKIMKDEGAEVNTTNLPTDEGTGYSLVLTATEMSAARIRLYIIDQTATKIWLDYSIGIETYGNASAEHAFDLDADKVTLAAATHTGAIIPTVTTLSNLPSIPANWITAAGINAAALNGKGDWNIGKAGYSLTQTFPANFTDLAIEVTTGKVNGKTVDVCTLNSDMRGTDNGALASVCTEARLSELAAANLPADIDTLLTRLTAARAAVLSDWIDTGRLDVILDAINTSTAGLAGAAMRGTDGANTIAPDNAGISGIALQIGIAGAGLTDLGGMSTGMKAEVLAEMVKVLTTQMAESYASDGVSPTMTQALMLIQQVLTEFVYSGTSFRVNKLDGITQAANMMLDDDTNPTSATRTS